MIIEAAVNVHHTNIMLVKVRIPSRTSLYQSKGNTELVTPNEELKLRVWLL